MTAVRDDRPRSFRDDPGSTAVLRTIVLVTRHLRLTTWLDTDLADLYALHSDPQVMRYMKAGAENYDQSRSRLARFIREQYDLGWTKWRAEDHEGKMVGSAGFNLSRDRRHRELGYLLEPGLWGRGIASEVATALVRWHQDHLDPAIESELQAFALSRAFRAAGFSRKRGSSLLTNLCTVIQCRRFTGILDP